MSYLKDYINSYSSYCQEQIERLERQIKDLPRGHLAVYTYNGHTRYKHLLAGRKPKNISKKDSYALQKLAQKNICQASLEDFRAEHDICVHALEEFKSHPGAKKGQLEDPGIRCLLSQANSEAKLQAWANADYKRYSGYEEYLNVPTEAGFFVRSKSEAMIVSALLELEIPFHYEEELDLGGWIVHPDFTLLRPDDQKLIYMEHFGMMDDTDYALNAARKLLQYISNGYIPDIDLICFYETKTNPLNISYVKKVLRELMLK